ncbi:hypothetical protein [Paenibacillus sp. ATY16]|nr:hypothetical protein [Paenibacillus sp. ATY16]
MSFAPKRDLWLSVTIWVTVGILAFSAISMPPIEAGIILTTE